MLALIDGDIVLHRCGYASDNDSEDIALVRTDVMLREILHDVGADQYEIYLSDDRSNNYRYEIDPEYKANRKQPRPIHYDAIKDYIFREWQGNLSLGQEADDSLGIRQCEIRTLDSLGGDDHYLGDGVFVEGDTESIICSIDKDLLQIPGRHYNFVRKEFQDVEYTDGIRHFYKQMLIGDTSDNVRGVEKVGPVRAGKYLDAINDERRMFDVVRELYADDNRMLKNGKLLWIRRLEEEEWNFEKAVGITQEQEVKL